jgi:hypothetical protein
MKLFSIFLVGIVGILLSSCSTTPKENFQQANESDLVQADVSLHVLKSLDAGHTDRARKIAMIPVYNGMDEARFCNVHRMISLTPEEKQEWMKIARETLDYMLRHTDECDSRDLGVQAGIRGLRYFLTEPDDVRRIGELSERLAQNEKKRLKTQKPVMSY